MAEGALADRRKLMRREPGELGAVVRRPLRAAGDARVPGQAEDGAPVVVGLHPHADEGLRLDLEPGLLAELTDERVERMFGLLEEPAGQVPEADARVEGSTAEKKLPVALDERLHGRGRVRPDDVPARRAGEVVAAVLARRRAAGARSPAVQECHRATVSR